MAKFVRRRYSSLVSVALFLFFGLGAEEESGYVGRVREASMEAGGVGAVAIARKVGYDCRRRAPPVLADPDRRWAP